ncbi:MAG: hypothetical protein AAF212_05010 [Verrucomicrobiota bacterium]
MENSASASQPAKLNKTPFIATDIILSLSAVGITLIAEKPLGVWTIAICLSTLFVGFIFLVTPFILEFSLHLQARNEDLEKGIHAQSEMLEDALERWNRLHAEVKSMFESSKLNIAGYEGLLHRFDQRLEVLDARLLEIERVARVFETGLKDMAERAETLHAQEVEAWESRLSEHRDSIQQTLSALRTSSSDSGKSNGETRAKLETLGAQFDRIEEQLQSVAERLAAVAETPDSDTLETWTDPSGRYTSMLDRALSENAQKPTLPVGEVPDEPAQKSLEHPKSLESPKVSETENAAENENNAVSDQKPKTIDTQSMPILDDDFIDEVIPEPEADTAEIEDIDWPEPESTLPEEDAQSEELEPVEEVRNESEEINKPTLPKEETASEPVSITASILIGIGDKIFVRGEGPGLSLDQGAEMEFVNIGSYRWSHESACEPIKLEFYLNDEIPALEGPITLNPGEHIEISPDFP